MGGIRVKVGTKKSIGGGRSKGGGSMGRKERKREKE